MEMLVDGQRGDKGVYWAEDVNVSGIPIMSDNFSIETMCAPEYYPAGDSVPYQDCGAYAVFRPPYVYERPNGNSSLYNPAIGPNTSDDECELTDNERVTVIAPNWEAGNTGYVITIRDVMNDSCNWGIDIPAMRIDPEKISCGQVVSVEIGLINQQDYGGVTAYGCSFVVPIGTLCCPFDLGDKVGSLTVSIDPPEADAAGAQWRVGDGTWHNSTDTQYGLPPGDYSVTFKNIAHWETPDSKQVNILGGQTSQTYGTYKQMDTISMPWLPLLLE